MAALFLFDLSGAVQKVYNDHPYNHNDYEDDKCGIHVPGIFGAQIVFSLRSLYNYAVMHKLLECFIMET